MENIALNSKNTKHIWVPILLLTVQLFFCVVLEIVRKNTPEYVLSMLFPNSIQKQCDSDIEHFKHCDEEISLAGLSQQNKIGS